MRMRIDPMNTGEMIFDSIMIRKDRHWKRMIRWKTQMTMTMKVLPTMIPILVDWKLIWKKLGVTSN